MDGNAFVTHGRSLEPGAIYHSATFAGPWHTTGCPYVLWQRVTDPNAPNPGAREFLPNRINHLELPPLDDVESAEVCVECWGGHAGTSGKAIRFNDGSWLSLGEPAIGGSEISEAYQTFRYPVIDIDPGVLKNGLNTFEATAGPQRYGDFGWGQWGFYGVTVRLYRSEPTPDLKPTVQAAANGAYLELTAHWSEKPRRVDRVDFVGLYEDFDYHGDGRFRDWHYALRYGKRLNTLATTYGHPHTACVDTTWIPVQDTSSLVVAVVTDFDGNSYVSEPAEIAWPRPQRARMYRPLDVPPSWHTRDGHRHGCRFELDGDTEAVSQARLTLATWNGLACDSVEINGTTIAERIGRDHDFAITDLDVPVGLLRSGTNEVSTYSGTKHHGIEVIWPGPVLKTLAPIR